MRILIQAVRAVVVELLGVILVLWLLFGGVSWTLESANAGRAPGGTPPSTAPRWSAPAMSLPNVLASIKNSVSTRLAAARGGPPEPSERVAERLDYYSRLYRRAATGYLRRVTEDLSQDLSRRTLPPRPGAPGAGAQGPEGLERIDTL